MSILETLGFEQISNEIPLRLAMALWGGGGVGKTRFALTAAKPMAYFQFDLGGEEGVAPELPKEGVFAKRYKLDADPKFVQHYARDKKDQNTLLVWNPDDAQKVVDFWLKFRSEFIRILDSQETRTMVIDHASDAYDFCRLAHFIPDFGRQERVGQLEYGKPKQDFRELIERVKAQEKTSLILLFKEKPIYINDKRTKRTEMVAPKDLLDYAVPLTVKLWIDEEALEEGEIIYRSKITRTRKDQGRLLGKAIEELPGPWDKRITFPKLAALYTGTRESEWK